MFPHPNRNVVLTPPQYSPSAPYAPEHTDKQALRGGGEGRGVCGVEVVDTISTFRHIASGLRSLGGRGEFKSTCHYYISVLSQM